MSYFIPKLASAKSIQRNYRSLFDEVIKTREPLLVLNSNDPEVVILDIQTYEELAKMKVAYELLMAKNAIGVHQSEKRKKALKKIRSLKDIF